MVRWRLDVAGTRKTGWGLLRCSHPDGILSPASESSDSGGADSKGSEKLSLGSRKKKKKRPLSPHGTLLYQAVTISFSSYSLSLACSH